MPAVVDLAAMRDAHRDARRRSAAHQPAAAGRSRHRPLGAGRRVRHRRGVPHQHRARVRAQPGALRRSCAGDRTRSRTSASCRRAPASCHQVNLEYLGKTVFVHEDDGDGRVSRLARRHRLAHDDDQRPRRARLGRRRHRGRGGDARPAGVDAHSRSRRLQAARQASRRARRRRISCSPSREMLRKKKVVGKFVEFYGTGLSSSARSPIARRSPTWRRSTARRWASSPSTRRRSSTCA